MTRALAAFAALLLLAPLAPAHHLVGVTSVSVQVEGETAHGLLALPLTGPPVANVLILHGYTHNASSHENHLAALAALGAAAVAMDYRGPREGFPLENGAADSCAAFLPLMDANPTVPRILYSVSMGTAVAALVLEECPVFDWWVNSEGLSMLHETWAGATALHGTGNPTAVNAKKGIEDECGGTPADAPYCYVERSAALKARQFTRLQGVYLAHGLNDGIVPYDQGREMVAALRAAGIPSDFYTVARGNVGGEGTTITSYLGQDADGIAGHGSESNDDHTLTRLTFGLLYELVRGDLAPPRNAEFVVDREAGTTALP